MQAQADREIERRIHTSEFLRHHPEYANPLLRNLPPELAQAFVPLIVQPEEPPCDPTKTTT